MSAAHLGFYCRFGRHLRKLRTERGYTQLRLAQVAGIDRSFISDVERGRKCMTVVMLNVLAVTYEMSLSAMLEGL